MSLEKARLSPALDTQELIYFRELLPEETLGKFSGRTVSVGSDNKPLVSGLLEETLQSLHTAVLTRPKEIPTNSLIQLNQLKQKVIAHISGSETGFFAFFKKIWARMYVAYKFNGIEKEITAAITTKQQEEPLFQESLSSIEETVADPSPRLVPEEKLPSSQSEPAVWSISTSDQLIAQVQKNGSIFGTLASTAVLMAARRIEKLISEESRSPDMDLLILDELCTQFNSITASVTDINSVTQSLLLKSRLLRPSTVPFSFTSMQDLKEKIDGFKQIIVRLPLLDEKRQRFLSLADQLYNSAYVLYSVGLCSSDLTVGHNKEFVEKIFREMPPLPDHTVDENHIREILVGTKRAADDVALNLGATKMVLRDQKSSFHAIIVERAVRAAAQSSQAAMDAIEQSKFMNAFLYVKRATQAVLAAAYAADDVAQMVKTDQDRVLSRTVYKAYGSAAMAVNAAAAHVAAAFHIAVDPQLACFPFVFGFDGGKEFTWIEDKEIDQVLDMSQVDQMRKRLEEDASFQETILTRVHGTAGRYFSRLINVYPFAGEYRIASPVGKK